MAEKDSTQVEHQSVESLRRANQKVAKAITNSENLTDRELWYNIEDAKTALRNAQHGLTGDTPDLDHCRECGCGDGGGFHD